MTERSLDAPGVVESVNVGTPRSVQVGGHAVLTAIWKQPVSGRVPLRGVNLLGDDQADRTVHGGPDKAVYAYAREDIDWWEIELEHSVGVAPFGENLTVIGLPGLRGRDRRALDDRVRAASGRPAAAPRASSWASGWATRGSSNASWPRVVPGRTYGSCARATSPPAMRSSCTTGPGTRSRSRWPHARCWARVTSYPPRCRHPNYPPTCAPGCWNACRERFPAQDRRPTPMSTGLSTSPNVAARSVPTGTVLGLLGGSQTAQPNEDDLGHRATSQICKLPRFKTTRTARSNV